MNVSIDEALLTRIAHETGGAYFRATDAKSLDSIYTQIDKLERTEIRGRAYGRYTQYFGIPLGIALVLLVLSLVLRATVLRRLP